jgi:hypothetical protein
MLPKQPDYGESYEAELTTWRAHTGFNRWQSEIRLQYLIFVHSADLYRDFQRHVI